MDATATFFETIGWFGTAAAIIMFLPQVWKVVRKHDYATLSASSFGIYGFGAAMWVVYCASTAVWQGVACNGVILLLITWIFYYLFKGKVWRYGAVVGFAVATFAVAVVLIFVLDPSQTGLAVNYVFVVLAGAALAVSFVPQVRTIFIDRDFKSYSFLTSAMIVACNVFWGIFWGGKMTGANGPAGDLLGTLVLSFIFTASQIFVQLAAWPIYFKTKRAQGALPKQAV